MKLQKLHGDFAIWILSAVAAEEVEQKPWHLSFILLVGGVALHSGEQIQWGEQHNNQGSIRLEDGEIVCVLVGG